MINRRAAAHCSCVKSSCYYVSEFSAFPTISTEEIQVEAVRYFSSFHKAGEEIDYRIQAWVIDHMLVMLYLAANEIIGKEIKEEEIGDVLKYFAQGKIFGSDGWPTEFHIHFFDIMSEYILVAIEMIRLNKNAPGDMNLSFLALIPKSSNPQVFSDYKPITLCNTIYKITSKIISNRLKGFLSNYISVEQHGFLKGRAIHDVVTTTQEVIHSIHTRKLEALILKVDLYKAYDCVDWSFIRLLLLKVGFTMKKIRWVMACVSTRNYAVIINGTPTIFFKADKGLCQGCVLSPLIFILIMDFFSKLLHRATWDGFILGFSLSSSICITHSLFLVDLLVFGGILRNKWFYIHYLLNRFGAASGLHSDTGKYLLLHGNGDLNEINAASW